MTRPSLSDPVGLLAFVRDGVETVEYHGFRVLHRSLRAALARYGKPAIFNTDQGSQFTSLDFTGVLKDAKVAISVNTRLSVTPASNLPRP